MRKFITILRPMHRYKLAHRKNAQKGFSLVELVVVIGVMAVLISILAPSLLSYTEKARAQKDDSTMDEVVNAVQLAMSDQKCYDGVLRYSTLDNVSCYIDKSTEDGYSKMITKIAPDGEVSQYMFDSSFRVADATPYTAAGNMRGVTITFEPDSNSNNLTYNVKDAVINKFINKDNGAKLADCEYLYNTVRQTIGDTIKLNSATYKNSDYTVFIRLGTTGGNAASDQDAIVVYGQYSGTNLTASVARYSTAIDREVGDSGINYPIEDDTSSEGGTPEFDDEDLGGSGTLQPDNSEEDFLNPDHGTVPIDGEKYKSGDYTYTYQADLDGWHVSADSNSKTEYGPILHSINSKPIKSMYRTFNACSNMITAPEIPDTVVNMENAFTQCASLVNVPAIPSSVENMNSTFISCTSLVIAPDMTNAINVSSMSSIFCACESLQDVSKVIIPEKVTSTNRIFMSCSSITSITVPWHVQEIGAFTVYNCTSLETIYFEGTMARWNSLYKRGNWKDGSTVSRIVCTDGTIVL